MATRVACNKEGNGDGGKSDGYKGDGQARATRVMAKVKATMTTTAVAVAEVATVMATVMVTVTAAATTTERGSAKVAKGKQATSKVNRRGSSTQHNNQPTTKRGMAKVAREMCVMPRWDMSSPNRVPLSKLLFPAAMSNTVAFSVIHSMGILNYAEGMPETITINIPMHRLMADTDNAPTCCTLPSGRNCSAESTSTEYTIAPAILDSIEARGRPRSSDRLIIVIVSIALLG
jgi:hypothetical protein